MSPNVKCLKMSQNVPKCHTMSQNVQRIVVRTDLYSLSVLHFLDASTHLYKRVHPSVCSSVHPSVRPSVLLNHWLYVHVLTLNKSSFFVVSHDKRVCLSVGPFVGPSVTLLLGGQRLDGERLMSCLRTCSTLTLLMFHYSCFPGRLWGFPRVSCCCCRFLFLDLRDTTFNFFIMCFNFKVELIFSALSFLMFPGCLWRWFYL